MRIRERDLVIPALRIAAGKPDGFIATEDLIIALIAEFEPSGEDAEILAGRHDSKFSQIVRNLVSHRTASTSMFMKAYAEYDQIKHGFRITDVGRSFLDQVPE